MSGKSWKTKWIFITSQCIFTRFFLNFSEWKFLEKPQWMCIAIHWTLPSFFLVIKLLKILEKSLDVHFYSLNIALFFFLVLTFKLLEILGKTLIVHYYSLNNAFFMVFKLVNIFGKNLAEKMHMFDSQEYKSLWFIRDCSSPVSSAATGPAGHGSEPLRPPLPPPRRRRSLHLHPGSPTIPPSIRESDPFGSAS